MIRRRRETPEIGWGTWRVLETDPPAVLGHRCDWEGRTFVAVHNLGGDPCVARVQLGTDLPEDPRLLDLFDRDGAMNDVDAPELEVKLEGYGYRWLRIHSAGQLISP
jgi:maltose alpha-D-glucosyltransferase / alpha-amylase